MIFFCSYGAVEEFLKATSKGYKPKKSRILSKDNVSEFLEKADDEPFLLAKVSFINKPKDAP